MKKDCADHGLRFIGPAEFLPTEGRITQFDWEPEPKIHLDNKDLAFEFWQPSNRLAFFYNQALDAVFYGKDAPPSDKLDAAKRPDQEGVQKAQAFLNLLDVPSGIRLGNPVAEFDLRKTQLNYLHGEWNIHWPRIDAKGYQFAPDIGVVVVIPNGYGPLSLAAALNIPYSEEPGEPLTQTDALAKARAKIASVRSGARVFDSFIPQDSSIAKDEFLRGELEIVGVQVPPRRTWIFFKTKTMPEHTARLAWVFWFYPIFKSQIAVPPYDHTFAVSIDAYTGEYIGSSAMN